MINIKSKITRAVLNYFFLNPKNSLYINEIMRTLEVDKRNLVKKLKELEAAGVLNSSERGNMRFYSLSPDYPFLKEYKKIIMKTSGLEAEIKRIAGSVKGVKSAYIFGSYASGKMDEASDIDVLVAGSHKATEVLKQFHMLRKKTGREINVINIDAVELRRKLRKKDPFYINIVKGKHIQIK